MTIAAILASLAAIASTASFAPQAVKVIRTQDTKAISVGMYLLTVTAFALWSVYGVLTRQWPLVACNLTCLVLAGFILVVKMLRG